MPKFWPKFFENGLSGVRLYIVGSLVDFDFVCWCSRVPSHYALSATANVWYSMWGVRQTNQVRNHRSPTNHLLLLPLGGVGGEVVWRSCTAGRDWTTMTSPSPPIVPPDHALRCLNPCWYYKPMGLIILFIDVVLLYHNMCEDTIIL